ncbi:hypothetical protein BK652_05500 [Pseudomonas brassicacearum]|uniref:Uncharacterized protein n=1 Tax=Pseudomonas brassicacearum TaxID=930166 RepID=A0A423GFS2_9PSED|nr:hypothetical protein BK652_05500 [Pseudomonas brassicacearum]
MVLILDAPSKHVIIGLLSIWLNDLGCVLVTKQIFRQCIKWIYRFFYGYRIDNRSTFISTIVYHNDSFEKVPNTLFIMFFESEYR